MIKTLNIEQIKIILFKISLRISIFSPNNDLFKLKTEPVTYIYQRNNYCCIWISVIILKKVLKI